MILRIILAIKNPAQQRQLQKLIADEDVLIQTIRKKTDLLEQLSRESCDLVIASLSLVTEPVAGTVTLRSEHQGLTFRPLSSDGTAGPPMPFECRNGVCTLVLPTDTGTHWFLLSAQ